MKRINYWLLAIMLIAFISCNEDKTDPNGKGEVVLSVSQSLKSSIKNDSDYKMTSVKKAVVTLKKDGVVLADYNQAEIAVYNMSGEYFTKKLLLLNGQYSVDEFYLVDENNTTLFATPLDGSKQAQNVSTPLPLVFNVETDKSASVNIEVLSTENLSPTDFGLSSLHISEVKTIPFFINVSELGKKELLEAEVVVKSGDYTFTDTTKSIVNNPIIVKKGFGNYTVIVKKDGFQKFEKIYTAEELTGFKENPLVVELEKAFVENKVLIDGNQGITHMVKIADGYIAVGSASGNCYICSFTKDFTKIWDKSISDNKSSSFYNITKLADGKFVCAGTISSNDGLSNDNYLVKINTDGNILWEKTFGTQNWDHITDVEELQSGDLIVAARTNGDVDSGILTLYHLNSAGEIVNSYNYGNNTGETPAKMVIDNNFIYLTGGSNGSFWVSKFDMQGNNVWEKRIGSGFSRDLLIDDGKIVVVGEKNNGSTSLDLCLMKFDLDGNVLLDKDYIYSDIDYVRGLAKGKDNNYYTFGYTGTNAKGTRDGVMHKIDINGNEISRYQFGGNGKDYGSGIIIDNENIILYGTYNYQVDSDIWCVEYKW